MPLISKPKADQTPVRDEAAIQAVIHKGLASPSDVPAEMEDKEKQVVLFLPSSLLAEVDRLVKTVRPRTSRRAWLVEAIREKVETDKNRLHGSEAIIGQ
jgi:hypothetical protein